MGHSQIMVFSLAALALSFMGVAQAESVSEKLQEGIYQEETVGDIDAAITIYEKILDNEEARRFHIAQAIYRLAFCHLKKGEKEKAAALFAELIEKYPEQKRRVASAQDELNKLQPASRSGDLSGAANQPLVLHTVPPTYTADIDPGLEKITVTFDQPMLDGSWSWTGSGDTFPEQTGEFSYDSTKTTCTMPVRLEPGKVYWIGVNSPGHTDFMTPARRYVIVFATRDSQDNPTTIPDEMLSRARQVNFPFNRPVTDKQIEAASVLSQEGWRLWQQQKMGQAEAKFKASLDQNPCDANAWNGLGWAQFNRGMPVNARESFMNCLYLEPCHGAALNGLGWAAKGQGNVDQALCFWEWAVEAAPSATAALNGLVQTYLELGENDKARKYVQLWLDVEPTSEQAQDALKQANQSARTAVTPSTISAADRKASVSLATRGWQLWGQQNPAEAEKLFQQAVEKDPGNTNAWNGLGWSQFNQGKTDPAAKAFKACIGLEPKHAAALNGLGWIAKNKGQVDEALNYWEQAVEIQPGATAALSGLATTCQEQKNYEKAAYFYKKWLQVEPGNDQAKSGLAQVQAQIN